MMGLSLTQISTKFGILVGRHVSWTWGGAIRGKVEERDRKGGKAKVKEGV